MGKPWENGDFIGKPWENGDFMGIDPDWWFGT
jgi:hypothetical protein